MSGVSTQHRNMKGKRVRDKHDSPITKGEKNMFSVKLDKRKKMITIQLPLEKPRISASGKTLLIGSTHGLRTGEAQHGGQPIVVVANAFVYPQPKPEASTVSQSGGRPSVIKADCEHSSGK